MLGQRRRTGLAGRRLATAAFGAFLVVGGTMPASADQVTDQIHAAEGAYTQRNYSAALAALASASSLIRQMKADAWKAVLPAPPSGWTAGPAKTMTVAPALLGGGTSVERHYFRGDGASVDISLIADAPMLQSVATLLGAGMLLSGSETMQIEGQRVSYDADDNTLQAIVAD